MVSALGNNNDQEQCVLFSLSNRIKLYRNGCDVRFVERVYVEKKRYLRMKHLQRIQMLRRNLFFRTFFFFTHPRDNRC